MSNALGMYIAVVFGLGIWVYVWTHPNSQEQEEITGRVTRKKKSWSLIVMVIYILVAIAGGIGIANHYQDSVSECEKNGCQMETQERKDVFEKSSEIVSINDEECTIWIDWELVGTGSTATMQEVYRYFYINQEGEVLRGKVPTANTRLITLEEGNTPYIEEWTRYNNSSYCSVCGREENWWKNTIYKLYYVKGSIQTGRQQCDCYDCKSCHIDPE